MEIHGIIHQPLQKILFILSSISRESSNHINFLEFFFVMAIFNPFFNGINFNRKQTVSFSIDIHVDSTM